MPIIAEIIGRKVVFAKLAQFSSERSVIATIIDGEVRSEEQIYYNITVTAFSDMIVHKVRSLQVCGNEVINVHVNANGLGSALYDKLREQGLNVMPLAGTGNMIGEYGCLPRPVK